MNKPLKAILKQMALTPRQQLKRLCLGTLIAIIAMLALLASSNLENPWIFYPLSGLLIVSVLYALPGYLGIWLWRMRQFFFDLD